MKDGLIFGTLACLLLTSIIRTIRTSPGNIPEEKEWDMLTTDNMSSSSSSSDEGDNGEVGFSSESAAVVGSSSSISQMRESKEKGVE